MLRGSAIWVKHIPTGKYLFQHRTDEPGNFSAGNWSIPSGTQEDGETPLKCAQRELKEETGLELTLTFLKDGPVDLLLDGKTVTVFISMFYGETDLGESELVLGEEEDLQYFTIEEALKLQLEPEIRKLIESGELNL